MKFTFDPNQDFQLNAINATIRVFNGQQKQNGLFSMPIKQDPNDHTTAEQSGYANILNIAPYTLYNNVQGIQLDNKITPDTVDENPQHFTIEMETGTGKTYVYLRSIFEMHKQYDFKKFCIVVPSVAIREGVLKSLEIMDSHFKALYDNVDYKYFVYNSQKLSNIRTFATANTLQIMVINIDSFNKDLNNIHTYQEKIQAVPIELIQKTNPIVIIDEPQNMESNKAKDALNTLTPLATFRYSATHITKHNPLYVLNAVHAYNRRLVKQIEVASVTTQNDNNTPYIKVISTTNTNTIFSAKISVDVQTKTSIVRKTITVKRRDDLAKKTKRDIYNGYIIDDICCMHDKQYINFTNKDDVIYAGQAIGDIDMDDIKYRQIYETIKIHMEKQFSCYKQKIKVLSLFFLDKVENYRVYTDTQPPQLGKYGKMFENAFKEILNKNPKYQDIYCVDDIQTYHNGYFSKDRKGNFKNTKGTTKDDEHTYSLIMKDKEKLLSFDSKLQFIFSHSTLREGWDNPNVFQICTLNDTHSPLKKRQEIGRGLRLCVDQNGQRRRDIGLNILTVIANESYESFAETLQHEYEADTNEKFEKSNIKNRAERKNIALNKQVVLSPEFKDLWEKIKQKTRYTISYDTADLLKKCQQYFQDNEIDISPVYIHIEKNRIDTIHKQRGLQVDTPYTTQNAFEVNTHLTPPDIISYIQQRVHLNRRTIVDILRQSRQLHKFSINPQQFMDKMVDIINETKQQLLVDGVAYHKKHAWYEQDLFETKELKTYMKNNQLPKYCIQADPKKYPYEMVICDSEPEIQFAKDCNANEYVKIFAKLPYWFTVPTPIGTYNPDWAVLVEKNGTEKLYFVVETKSTTDINQLRKSEQQKIVCGKKHFTEINTTNALLYKVATKLSEIL